MGFELIPNGARVVALSVCDACYNPIGADGLVVEAALEDGPAPLACNIACLGRLAVERFDGAVPGTVPLADYLAFLVIRLRINVADVATTGLAGIADATEAAS